MGFPGIQPNFSAVILMPVIYMFWWWERLSSRDQICHVKE
jgi:hypothetical protein